ncbi:oxidoreductase [Lactobacillus sp. ESL0233]|uniref:NAD(P)H-binding protein n=1 Tax=Lactobacillus sp. ESL0233 TaxID=2069354 RepID=UPI000EFCE2A0|nr:NAD(P)H-binding protein [Lactobacillus sp. ESL0233]RMC40288.1 oxidoreductase [Lactobacillus sp. ESL0233]
MKFLILAANGQIAQIVEQRILNQPDFNNIKLTLGLRHADRLAKLADSARVLEVDLLKQDEVDRAINGQDLVLVAVVDHSQNNTITKNVITAMKNHHVSRVLFTNILGIYNEVSGEFGRWNHEYTLSGLATAINSDRLLADSGLQYTTLRLPWLNDRNEIKYTITTRHQPYVGVSGSRQSIADAILKIVLKPELYVNDSIGIADPATQGQEQPVY